jgi:hypothetical protein
MAAVPLAATACSPATPLSGPLPAEPPDHAAAVTPTAPSSPTSGAATNAPQAAEPPGRLQIDEGALNPPYPYLVRSVLHLSENEPVSTLMCPVDTDQCLY